VLATSTSPRCKYSQKKFGFVGRAARTRRSARHRSARAASRPHLERPALRRAVFSALDPENRNNRQFSGSLSYTLSTKNAGTHDIKGGGEYYRSQRTGGTRRARLLCVPVRLRPGERQPVYDAQGVPTRRSRGVSRLQNWAPDGRRRGQHQHLVAYVQDHWVASPRLSVDLGTRFEAVRSTRRATS